MLWRSMSMTSNAAWCQANYICDSQAITASIYCTSYMARISISVLSAVFRLLLHALISSGIIASGFGMKQVQIKCNTGSQPTSQFQFSPLLQAAAAC